MRVQVLTLLVTLACLADTAPYTPYYRQRVQPYYGNKFAFSPYADYHYPNYETPYFYRRPSFRYRPYFYSAQDFAAPGYVYPFQSPSGAFAAAVPRPPVKSDQPQLAQSDFTQKVPAVPNQISSAQLVELLNYFAQDFKLEQLVPKIGQQATKSKQEEQVADKQEDVFSPVSQQDASRFDQNQEVYAASYPGQLDFGSQSDLEQLFQTYQTAQEEQAQVAEVAGEEKNTVEEVNEPAFQAVDEKEVESAAAVEKDSVETEAASQEVQPAVPQESHYEPQESSYVAGEQQEAQDEDDKSVLPQEIPYVLVKEHAVEDQKAAVPEEVPYVVVNQHPAGEEKAAEDTDVQQAFDAAEVQQVPAAQPVEVVQEYAEPAVQPAEQVAEDAAVAEHVAQQTEQEVEPAQIFDENDRAAQPVAVLEDAEPVQPAEVAEKIQESDIAQPVETAQEYQPYAPVAEVAVQEAEAVVQDSEPVAVVADAVQGSEEPAVQYAEQPTFEAEAIVQDVQPVAGPAEIVQDAEEPAVQSVEQAAPEAEAIAQDVQPVDVPVEVEAVQPVAEEVQDAVEQVQPVAVAAEAVQDSEEPAVQAAEQFVPEAEAIAQDVQPVNVPVEFAAVQPVAEEVQDAIEQVQPVAVAAEAAQGFEEPVAAVQAAEAPAAEFVEQPAAEVEAIVQDAEPVFVPAEAAQDQAAEVVQDQVAEQVVQTVSQEEVVQEYSEPAVHPEKVALVQDPVQPIAAEPQYVAPEIIPAAAEIPSDDIAVVGFNEPAPQPVAESQILEQPQQNPTSPLVRGEELIVESGSVQVLEVPKAAPQAAPQVIAIPARVEPVDAEPAKKPTHAARVSSQCRAEYDDTDAQPAVAEVAEKKVEPVAAEKKIEFLPIEPAVVEQVDSPIPPLPRKRITLIFNPKK